ncbi:MAG: Loader and inhibitor of phage [Actinomycetota bacterium]
MNRSELVAIVDIVRAAWGRDDWRDDEQKTVRAWWRYLQDLEFNDVLATVDSLVVAGDRFPPTVGTVRRMTIDRTAPDGRPTATEAWRQATDRARAVETGVDWPDVHPMVAVTLAEAGYDGKGRLDERTFKSAWDAVTARVDQDRYAVSSPEPFGESR